MIKEHIKIEVVCKGGGSIISLPPVFSCNAEYLYVAKACNIIGYNVLTGKKVIEFSGAHSEIIGFGAGLINDNEHIVACTKNGRIVLWKCITGLKLREINTDLSRINFFKIFAATDDDNNQHIKAFICCENKSKLKFKILDLKTENTDVVNLRGITLKGKVFVDVADSGKFAAIAQGAVLYFYQINSDILRRYRIRDRIFTHVLCHPTEEIILTGDNTGRVVIWENLLRKSPSQAVYHWHTLPVKAASFSKSGTQFYSGGSECVLVQWIINDNHKNFVPRLPGYIEHIATAPNNLYIAVSTSDNGICILSPQMRMQTKIQHLAVGNFVTTDLTYDSRTKSLLFNGIPGHVQFFSPRDLNLVYSLDVSGQNKYTDERETVIVNSSITHVSIDKTGFWMATVEERMDLDMFESRLKFWFYDVVKQSFTLNTSIEYPHEGSIIKLSFQPSNSENELHCITIGNDKKFKIWQVVPIKTVYCEGYVWECTSDVSYRNLCPNVSSFSSDGSLLAVGFESIVTAWLPDTCELKCSLRHPIQDDDLCHLSFGIESQCHLLLSATRNFISVWNLLSLSLVWTVSVNVQCVVSDITTSFKAVFTTNKKLYIFELQSPKPVYMMKKLKNISDIQSAVFVPWKSIASDDNNNWAQRFSIYILTSNFELYAIESTNSEMTENNLHIKEDQSFFKNMLPEIRNVLLNDQQQVHSYAKDIRGKKFQQILDTPVPALQLPFLCEDILGDSLVQQDPNLPIVDMTIGKDIDKNLDDKIGNKLFDKQLSIHNVCTEKTQWTSVLL